MQEYTTQLETELSTGERELPPDLSEEELDGEETLMEKMMGKDYQKFFNK